VGKSVNFIRRACGEPGWAARGAGGACGSGFWTVILTPLERGDGDASNGGRIIDFGWVLTELWWVEKRSEKKRKKMEKKRKKERMMNWRRGVRAAVAYWW
jgi:hypothetical protein